MSVEKNCKVCSNSFEVIDSRKDSAKYCSKKCQNTGQEKKETHKCKECGTKFKCRPCERGMFCSLSCSNTYNQRGEKNSVWNGGVYRDNQIDYGTNWAEMREKTLERDNRVCVVCKRGKRELGQNPDVHHIKPIKTFEEPEDANYLDNLITVCRKHHNLFEKV